MGNTRIGKIARLPKYIRDLLGERIENGETGKDLVKWLNQDSLVQDVLNEKFGGRPINEQNLSEWKQGGHQDWLRQEATRLLVCQMTEQSDSLEEAADGQGVSDRFAGIFAVEFARLATTLLEHETDPEKRWLRLCQVHRELSQLRRDDHRAMLTLVQRQRWNRQMAAEDGEADRLFDRKNRESYIAPLFAQLEIGSLAKFFGGGDRGHDIAAFILEVQNDLPVGRLGRRRTDQADPNPVTVNQMESSPIKPDQA